MSRLGAMAQRALVVLLAASTIAAPACRKLEPEALDPVRALRTRVLPGFHPPADGVMTPAQLDDFARVRRATGSRSEADVARAMGVEPGEVAWVRARVAEALLLLDARRVAETSTDEYAAAAARLRETRRTTRDPKAAARIDAEIAALERERAATRRGDAVSPSAAKNAALVAPRRAELEKLGP